MKTREGKLGLRKCTCCGNDRNSSVQRPFPCGREQSGFSDSSLAANDERAATFADRIDQLVEPSQLFVSAEQLGDSRISARGGQRPSRLLCGNATPCTTSDVDRALKELLRRTGGVAGEDPIELGSGTDAELEEHLAQVVLHRTRADE